MNALMMLALSCGSLESATNRTLDDGWFRFTLIEQAEEIDALFELRPKPELVPAPKESSMTERELWQRIARLTIKRDRIDRLLALTRGKLKRKRATEAQAEKDWRYKRWL